MTTREYISQKLKAFGNLSEAQLLDMSFAGGFGLDDEYGSDNAEIVWKSMVSCIEELVFSPKMKSVSESGISFSWDYDGLGKFYMWLCHKSGVTPDDEVAGMLGIDMIIDRTDYW